MKEQTWPEQIQERPKSRSHFFDVHPACEKKVFFRRNFFPDSCFRRSEVLKGTTKLPFLLKSAKVERETCKESSANEKFCVKKSFS